MKFSFLVYILLLSVLLLTGFQSCQSQRDTVASRGMQNLTAQFNILYNARELIDESERNIEAAFPDNYELILPVFKEPNETLSAPELAKLDEVLLKANAIANEKNLSNYVDDAYFLIGKANHLKSNFFNAVEFFNYVYANYPDEKEIRQAALSWKARSQMELDLLQEASITLDTAFKYLPTEKKSVANIYAAKAQLHIYRHQDKEAITLLEKAIEAKPAKKDEIRWTYIISQLQQLVGEAEKAFANYTRVVKSNAPFSMAFNANLNRISIMNANSGDVENRTEQLRALLKDDKNKEFVDQIYFQIANSYANENNLELATLNYNEAIRRSTSNQTQKGQAYLRLAEIYQNESDFVKAKLYFDSTLVVLPKNYPDYYIIENRSQNLELLADRLSVIAREDTLQMLASLPEADRELRIGALVREQAAKYISTVDSSVTDANTANRRTTLTSGNAADTRFYFNNSIAINQGLTDFKRRWGNRKLEDNWRRSQKSTAEVTSGLNPDQTDLNQPLQNPTKDPAFNIESIRRTFIEGMPLTADQKLLSDQKIAAAMFDIANYYRDVALDTAMAVETYENIIERFPESPNKLAVYYSLYRLYQFANTQMSERYKQILLNEYPDSPFAKVILDPNYGQRLYEQDNAFNTFYTQVYDLYAERKYQESLGLIQTYGQMFTGRALPAQLDYLRALAIGHTKSLAPLETAFKELVQAYPSDKLIAPLVKQHLEYIESNRSELTSRLIALEGMDPSRMPFEVETVVEPKRAPVLAQSTQSPAVTANAAIKEPLQIIDIPKPGGDSTTNITPNPNGILDAESSKFSLAEDADYYYVINVSDNRSNLNSSRFGIGQFNRINLPGSGISHQLKRLPNENQLIFVGPLSGKAEAEAYLTKILPLMGQIMKIPDTKYSSFIINKPNLDLITDNELLNQYIEFYKKNFILP